MGKSGRDKRKKAAAKRGEVTFGKGAAKTEAKTSKNEEKRKKTLKLSIKLYYRRGLVSSCRRCSGRIH